MLLIGIIYIIFFHKFKAPAVETPAMTEEKTPTQPTAKKEEPKGLLSGEKPTIKNESTIKREVDEEDLKRMAAAFAERFGSFSNQSDYGNIRDLKIFMSSRMAAWADDYIEKAIARGGDSSIYYGITAKAVTATVKRFDVDAGRAEVLVKTQRRESAGATSNTSSFYQDVLIGFIKEDGAWKVNSAYWQAK